MLGVLWESHRPAWPTSEPRSGLSGSLAKIIDSKIIYLGYTLLADRGALVAVVSEKHSEPPVV